MTTLLERVCPNIEAKPHLLPVDNKQFRLRSTNRSNSARLDIKACNFWKQGQVAFFDVRVTHVNSTTNLNHTTKEVFARHEQEEKRTYIQRITEIDQGSLTPLVFGTNGGTGKECGTFLRNLATKLADKENSRYESTFFFISSTKRC